MNSSLEPPRTVVFALCGSFCTFETVLPQIIRLRACGWEVLPMLSYAASALDTRFGRAADWKQRLEEATGHRPLEDLREAEEEGKIGALLSVEGGEAAGGNVEKLERMYKDGVRLMTLTWNYPNEIGWPNGMEGKDKGITARGWEIVEAMESLHMVVDTSHLNDEGTRDILAAGRPWRPTPMPGR